MACDMEMLYRYAIHTYYTEKYNIIIMSWDLPANLKKKIVKIRKR